MDIGHERVARVAYILRIPLPSLSYPYIISFILQFSDKNVLIYLKFGLKKGLLHWRHLPHSKFCGRCRAADAASVTAFKFDILVILDDMEPIFYVQDDEKRIFGEFTSKRVFSSLTR